MDNRSSRFLVILLTKKQRKKETKKLIENNTPSGGGVKTQKMLKYNACMLVSTFPGALLATRNAHVWL